MAPTVVLNRGQPRLRGRTIAERIGWRHDRYFRCPARRLGPCNASAFSCRRPRAGNGCRCPRGRGRARRWRIGLHRATTSRDTTRRSRATASRTSRCSSATIPRQCCWRSRATRAPCCVSRAHDHAKLMATLLHSVGSHIIEHATHPFVVVGPNMDVSKLASDVVVALDGVADPDPLLSTASAWAARLGTALRIVTVYEPVLADLRNPEHFTRSHGPPNDPDVYLDSVRERVDPAEIEGRRIRCDRRPGEHRGWARASSCRAARAPARCRRAPHRCSRLGGGAA